MSCSRYGCRGGSIGGGGETRAEDLAEVGQFAEVYGRAYLQEIESGGV